MNKILEKQLESSLAKIFKEFKNKKEVSAFLEDFLEPHELENLSKRLAIAYWLRKDRTEENILQNLDVSKETISKTKKLMKNKNFMKGVDLLLADEWAVKWATKIKKLTN